MDGPQGAPPAAPVAPNLPTLRVMRLYKPSLSQKNLEPYFGGADAMHGGPRSVLSRADDFGLGKALLLPDSFGNIYLGQTFCAYVSVLNHHGEPLTNVTCEAKLSTPTARITLAGLRAPHAAAPGESARQDATASGALESGEALDMVVEAPLRSTGTHTLQVTVACCDPRVGDVLHTFRKNYRFNVLGPLDFNFELSACGTFLQASIRNLTHAPLCLRDLRFQPSAGVEAAPRPPVGPRSGAPGDGYAAMHDGAMMLKPQEMLRTLYTIRRVGSESGSGSGSGSGEGSGGDSGGLGTLRVCYHGAMGEEGVVESAAAPSGRADAPSVRVRAEGLPRAAALHAAVPVTFRVVNGSDREIELQLQFRHGSMDGLVVQGRSFVNLGVLPPAGERDAVVLLLPLAPGLRRLDGVVLVDMVTSMEYPQPALGEVLVRADAPSP